jgi:deazaflavin-dependent oxidoreductase (nitroreductase family)
MPVTYVIKRAWLCEVVSRNTWRQTRCMESSMQGNDFVKILLNSPLQGLMGGNLMLITVIGRKSGRTITTPVNYYRDGNILWVISKRDRKWWRNLRGRADVVLRLQGRNIQACAEAITDEQVIGAQIGEYLRHLPMSAAPMSVRLQNGIANCEDTARLAKERVFVKIKLN